VVAKSPVRILPVFQYVAGDVEPIYPEDLPKGAFNTIQAKGLAGSSKEFTVCGTVVGTRISRAGNILLNLDKQFPNQIFTVFIKKEFIPNFTTIPVLPNPIP
jgi:endonuclease G